jgi:preprotein translocase subunit SecG
MEQLIVVLHVLFAIAIIALILLQQGKGADAGASFGSGASQTVFGSGGSGNALTRGTAILATLFFVSSFGLAVIAKQKAGVVAVDSLDMPAIEQSIENNADNAAIPVLNDSSSEEVPVE